MDLSRAFALLPFLLASVATPADAGWIIEWNNIPINSQGEPSPAEPATMVIDKGRVRLVQPKLTSLIDYNKSRFTVLDTDRKYFWSGTVEEYTREILKRRARSSDKKKKASSEPRAPKIDKSQLPKITIRKSERTEQFAGHDTVKYAILSDGEEFQEMWIAEDVDVSKDLDPEKFLAYQRTMSSVMLGKSARDFNALFRSEEYRELLKKGFALKTVTRHIAGGFERAATSIRQASISAEEFEVPKEYRRVQLSDVFASDTPS
jgi:hypothetical protein